MSRNRRFRQSLRRMIFAGLVAGAGFAPAAAAHVSPLGGQAAPSGNPYVQIGGRLVLPSQLSSWESRQSAAQPAASGFVAVGGDLVQRSQVGLYRHDELGTQGSSNPASTTAATTANSAGFDWRVMIIAVASVTAACLLLAAAYVVRRRLRLTPA